MLCLVGDCISEATFQKNQNHYLFDEGNEHSPLFFNIVLNIVTIIRKYSIHRICEARSDGRQTWSAKQKQYLRNSRSFLQERANGCEWDSDFWTLAAGNGHLEVIQWARANGCEWNPNTILSALASGHLQVAQWARENGCPQDW